jgi:predicted amidohydrolase
MTSRNRVAAFAAVLCCALASFTTAADTPPTTRPATVKVAAVQCSSDLGAVDANRQKLTTLCEEAAGNGARIIVLPEAAITGYLSQDLKTNWRLGRMPLERVFTNTRDPLPDAERVPGPSTKHFAGLAKRLGAYITVPLLERDDKPAGGVRLFNTVCLVSPKG